MKEKQLEAEAEGKQYERLKVTLQKPKLYELKRAEDRERARMYRMRKKLGLIKSLEPNDTTTPEEVQSTSYSLTTKQSLSKSVNIARKSLPASLRK